MLHLHATMLYYLTSSIWHGAAKNCSKEDTHGFFRTNRASFGRNEFQWFVISNTLLMVAYIAIY